MKKLLLVVVVALLVFCVPCTALADEAYDIISHDVYIKVSENNIIDVVERLTVNFTQERHGIYYNLQYKGTAYHDIEGEWVASSYKHRVYDFNVYENNFEISKDGQYLSAKIGDADEYVYGEKEYIITYKCDIGDNGYDEFDEFYRNVVNCDIEDTIQSASFVIELPKDFDETLVNVTVGQYGSMDTTGTTWEKDGNKLKGYTLRPLKGGEIVTLRMEFPDDYFVGESDTEIAWNNVVRGISGFCVLLAFILWLIYGKDNKIFPTVEFYAPDGMTPAEVGYIIDGCVDEKDVIALLMYWADKGYLKIIQKEKKDLKLVKLRDLPEGAKKFEQIMFNKLFKNRESVEVSDLKQSFYTTVESTKTSVANYFEGAKKRRVFTNASKSARSAMGIITMIPVALAVFMYCYRDTDSLLWSLGLAVLVGWIISLPVFMLAHVFEKWRSTQSGKRMVKLIVYIAVLTAVLTVYIFVVPALFHVNNDSVGVTTTLITAVSTIVMVILTVIMRKRTKHGDEWFAKILGFQNFIEKAEKDRIIMLVEENPSYFFNVLPYAYVLGVTNKWAKNFEGIGIQPPGWYSGYYGMNTFNIVMFTSMMSRNMNGFQSAMTSRPPSTSGGSGGGGFGGGGFSGGGFGGGGAGGSW